ADDVMALLGNYYGTPSAPVTVLQGIRAAVGPKTKVLYSRGADLVEGREDPHMMPLIDAAYMRPSAGASQQGLKGEYFSNKDLAGKPAFTRVDPTVAFRWDYLSPTVDMVARGELPASDALAGDNFSIRWTGQLLPPATGKYQLSVAGDDGFRLFVDDKLVIDNWVGGHKTETRSAGVDLVQGKPANVRLEYFEGTRDAEIRLSWVRPGAKPLFDEALDTARAADVIVFVGGLTADVEGEEMNVHYPGFAGGDRTDLRLPSSQQKLLEALQATGKPVVLVLTTGSALAVDWAQAKLPAILVAWYGGQRGGTGVADVLFGDANPAGRLPVTFYQESEKLPAFDDYSMKNRTYRYFTGEPLYPFGYGLSYTTFQYSDLQLSAGPAKHNGEIRVSVKVKNTGARAGDEVVQLYVSGKDTAHRRALKDLRGVERIALQPGEQKQVSFTLKPDRDLTYYDIGRKDYAVDPGKYQIQVGASSSDIRLSSEIAVAN
ncbi:MAG TPA: glycoside hydrolase family 3 C-terminal domain-containing protein, partial [Povalibacter sp.]|nr:glycoside hydrolase family 3 C-terminal domain-containing protein [Povalibacter sp.]